MPTSTGVSNCLQHDWPSTGVGDVFRGQSGAGARVRCREPRRYPGVCARESVCHHDIWGCVGSDNLNRRSSSHDSELSCAVLDSDGDFARDLRLQMLREHLERAADGSADGGLVDPQTAVKEIVAAAEALDAWHGVRSHRAASAGPAAAAPAGTPWPAHPVVGRTRLSDVLRPGWSVVSRSAARISGELDRQADGAGDVPRPHPRQPYPATRFTLITTTAARHPLIGLVASAIAAVDPQLATLPKRLSQPVASCQDAREGGFVASCDRARLGTWALVVGPALLVVIVSSCAVRAWIWRWVAAGLIRE